MELKDSDEELIRQALDHPDNPHLAEINYDSLTKHSFMKAKRNKPLFPSKLPTPSGKIELYSEQMRQAGFPALPTFTPLVTDNEHPFMYVPAPNHNFLNSTFSNNEKHIKLEKTPKLFINTKDAEEHGIVDGAPVRVWNSRGKCELTASVGEQVLQGVVVSQGLWADEQGKKQLVNALTPDRLSDMGGGATFFQAVYRLKRFEKTASIRFGCFLSNLMKPEHAKPVYHNIDIMEACIWTFFRNRYCFGWLFYR